ncbi:MAG: tetratricopeptide repeat protein [Opitutaceae bacterium]|jgi:tetratricopeptide (TPR) repeat protein
MSVSASENFPGPAWTDRPRWGPLLACAVIALAGLAAYSGSFSGPFVLDDLPSILDNATIRRIWPVGIPLSPPGGRGLTVEGRPLLNLSLALSHATSGNQVWGYHAFNLAVHILAGLVLFGIIRRTPFPRTNPSRAGTAGLAFAVALLWTVHPLQTESVSYVIQRAESLMGLLYLLSLYCFVRGCEGRGSLAWRAASVIACACGMATKEVMVSAPLVILFYDRAFISGSCREAWHRRRGYYAALSATWLLLAWLVIGAGNRGGTSGFGSGVPVFRYWLTQPGAIARYLRLCLWPAGQVFDYGTPWVAHAASVLPQAFLTAVLIGATGWALGRAPGPGGGPASAAGSAIPLWGFLGLMFFAVLAPTSLIPGNRQTLAEHRMYLALIPVLVAFFAAIAAVAGGRSRAVLPILALVLAVPLALATVHRNKAYRSALSLYSSDAANAPGNPFAQANLGTALLQDGRNEEAALHLREALRLQPFYPIAEDNLGNALLRAGGRTEAEEHYREAIRQDPNFADPHNNLGYALLEEDRVAAAAAEIETALRLDPNLVEGRNNLARALARQGRLPEALAQYRLVLGASPEYAEAHNDFGIALAQAGDLPGAITQYREAIRLKPDHAEAHYNLANALSAAGSLPDAVAEYRETLRLSPANLSAHDNLGNALLNLGRATEAAREYEAALRIDPSHALTHYDLGNALLRLNRPGDAALQFREALRLRPDFEPAAKMLENLGQKPPPAN